MKTDEVKDSIKKLGKVLFIMKTKSKANNFAMIHRNINVLLHNFIADLNSLEEDLDKSDQDTTDVKSTEINEKLQGSLWCLNYFRNER